MSEIQQQNIQQQNIQRRQQNILQPRQQNQNQNPYKYYNIYPLIVITFFVLTSFLYFMIHYRELTFVTSLQLTAVLYFYIMYFHEIIIKKKGENIHWFIFMNIFYMIVFSLFYNNNQMIERFTPVFFLFSFIFFGRPLFFKLIYFSLFFLKQYYRETMAVLFVSALIFSSLHEKKFDSLVRYFILILLVYSCIMYFINYFFKIYPEFWEPSTNIFPVQKKLQPNEKRLTKPKPKPIFTFSMEKPQKNNNVSNAVATTLQKTLNPSSQTNKNIKFQYPTIEYNRQQGNQLERQVQQKKRNGKTSQIPNKNSNITDVKIDVVEQ